MGLGTPPAEAGKEYFPALQAFRGIAALWVVLFHMDTLKVIYYVTDAVPPIVGYWLFDAGRAGVAFFFAISGFVIAHSLWGKAVDGAYVGRFFVRRSIRLDPAYWASIAIAVAVVALRASWNNLLVPLPDAGQVAAHLFYLQELLRVEEIQLVYWTLTYEIQFYLVLAVAAWLFCVLEGRGLNARAAASLVFGPLAVVAFVAAAHSREWALHGLFLNYWHAFFAGCLAYASGYRRLNPVPLFALCALMLWTGPDELEIFSTPAALGALVLFAAARTGYLAKGLAGWAWQRLGDISYSLYLLHLPVITIVAAFWVRIAGRGLFPDSLAFIVVLVACLSAATLLWLTVERPTHRLARRLFRNGDGSGVRGADPVPERG